MRPDRHTADLALRPYWWDDAPPETEGSAPPTDVDAAIVGSGYAGLAAAQALARKGLSVSVFDAGALGAGASTRNGGLVSSTLKLSAAQRKRLGPSRATALQREAKAAFDHLEHMIDHDGLDAVYERGGRFVAAHTHAARHALAGDVESYRALGVEARVVEPAGQRQCIGSDHYRGGLAVDGVGTVHPARFHRALRRAATAAGAVLCSHTPVHAVAAETRGFELLHAKGETWARQVLVATNGYTGCAFPWFRRRLVPVASYMVATEKLAPALAQELSPEGRAFADTRRILAYFRLSPDRTRLLFGGRASFTDQGEAAAAPRLRAMLVRIFPQVEDVRLSHAWRGNVAFTRDRLPHLAWHQGVLYAGGCQGSGVAMATWLGTQAAALLAGDRNRPSAFLAERFDAIPLYTGRPWFLPLLGNAFRLQDRLDRLRDSI